MEENSPLNQAFAHAADNSESFDFGFVQERAETCNLANFDFPPDEAAAMRERELARIAAELENEEPMYDEDEDDDDSFYIADRDEFDDDDDYDDDDTDFDFDDEDEDDYDRFGDSVGGGDDWDDDYDDEE